MECCKYNKFVDCDEAGDRCNRCGFNTTVAARRLVEIALKGYDKKRIAYLNALHRTCRYCQSYQNGWCVEKQDVCNFKCKKVVAYFKAKNNS